MQRTFVRVVSIGALTTALVTVAAGSASAARNHARFAPRLGFPALRAVGFGPGGPGFFGGLGGPGMKAGFGPFGGPGVAFGPGGAAALQADVLNDAANFLKISVSTLTSDLKGGKTLAQEATANKSTAQDLINALVADQTAVYDNEKAAGWITADQETALVNSFTAAVTDLVNNGPPVPPTGQGGPQGGPLQAAATYLGISVSDLQTDLKNGKSLADVVGSTSGKTVDGLVAALEAPAKTKLDAAVTAGTITAAQESTILAKMTTALTNFVNAKPGTNSSSGSSSTTTTNTVLKGLVRFITLTRYDKRL
jgi:hypothetical protein